MMFLMFPERFITVWQYDSSAPKYANIEEGPLGACGGTWWYYQYFIAGTLEREHMGQMWNPIERDSKGRWTNKNKACRLTRLLSMDNLIKSRFGNGWKPPVTTIDVTASQRG